MQQTFSPKNLAEVIGVSESSLRRWADDGLLKVTRTAGGHRRITLPDAISFIRQSGQQVVRPELLGLPKMDVADDAVDVPIEAAPADQLQTALQRGDAAMARSLIISAFMSGHSVSDLTDTMLQPAMETIGSLWKHEENGIYLEHRATDICVQIVNLIRSLLPTPSNDAPVAIGAAPSGDPYLLGSMLADCIMTENGWRTINLGPNTPWEVLASAATQNNARLIWLSINHLKSDATDLKGVRHLAEHAQQTNAHLVIGGRGCGLIRRKLPTNAILLSSMTELSAYVQGISRDIQLTGAIQ